MDDKDKILVEAKTMEEALLEAEQKLGQKREELDIEVIRKPKKGLFGLREYNAVIYASVRVPPSESPDQAISSEETFSLDGSAQVKNGKVEIIDPAPGGLAPTIVPGPNVNMILNGILVEQTTEVSSQDDIVLIADQLEPEWEPILRVNEDHLQAYLAIRRTKGQVYQIMDAEPQRELMIRARLIKTTDPEISLADLQAFLKEKNIVFGINEDNLVELVNSQISQELIIAQGEQGEPSQDAYIKFLYLEEDDAVEGDENEEAIVERVARHAVISVEPGQILAEVVPSVKGRPGKDVYGRVITPKPPKEVELVAGNGVELDQGGQRAFASISGRPEVSGAKVTVHPSYIISGDVDAKVGRIIFKGDVQIIGNVQDEMSIEATGQVLINGYAANSTIIAGSSVIVHRNIVGGTVRAGGLATICGKMMVTLDAVKTQLPQLLAASQQLLKHPSFAHNRDVARAGEGIILRMLLNNKFEQLPKILHDSREDLEKLVGGMDYPEIRVFAEEYEELYQKLSGTGPLTLKTLQLAETLFFGFIERTDQILAFLQEKAASTANLLTGYVQNSYLECSGEIRITGKGSYSSNIYAGGDVILQGIPGTFRGGEIVAGGNVVARELGSPAEVITDIRINPGKSVKADRVHPGVVIHAGSKLERITHEQVGFVVVGQP